MFTLATPVKLVGLLVLFVWCTVWCVYELTRPQSRTQLISNALHLVMAVVMLLMVAPPTWQGLTKLVPTPALVVVFALATAWFVAIAVGAARAPDASKARHLAGHATMFAAMTWHLAAMAAMAMVRAGMSGDGHGSGMGGMGGAAGTGSMTALRQPGGLLWLLALIGLPLMTYLMVATVLAVRKLFLAPGGVVDHSCHEPRPIGSRDYRLAALADAAMNGGMFWMSTGLLIPILPVFALLSF